MRFLSNAPSGRFSLAMYSSDQNFLKALFLRGPPGSLRPAPGPYRRTLLVFFLRSADIFPEARAFWWFLGISGLSAGPCENGPSFRKSAAGFFLQFSLQNSSEKALFGRSLVQS